MFFKKIFTFEFLMRRYILSFAIFLLVKVNGHAQSYGLLFNSHEVDLEKRTSLDLFPEDSFNLTKNFELGFDIAFIPNHAIYFGYIVRIISNDNQNIDLIYNQPSSTFKVITGENFSGISFTIDSLQLYRTWNRLNFKFDVEKHTLQFIIGNKLAGTCKLPVTGNYFKLLWGANDFQKFKTRDIPPMQIKDIRISENNSLKYFWPLSESTGNVCYDKISHKPAKVKNPVWIKPKYQKWEQKESFTMNGYAGIAYDIKHDKLYIAGADSLAIYTLKHDGDINWLPCRHQNLMLGHQEIYDTINDKLWDIYADQKKVVAYDFGGNHWDSNFPSGPVPVTQFWHVNKFISPADTSLYIIGGYGYLRYKNLVQRYQFATKKWDILSPSGDYFSPRYLSALGTTPDGKFAYIIGGYGSHNGDQMLDPRYYYDLLRFNVRENSFKKLYTLKPLGTPFTFANSLVIGPNPDEYYGLIFPNDSSNSNLQLIKGSLTDSALRLVGSMIPYNFHDIQSFADLYYSVSSNKLIAVTLFYSKEDAKEKKTEVKIYTLNFPPAPVDYPQPIFKASPIPYLLLFSILGFICIVFILLAWRYFNKRKSRVTRARTSHAHDDRMRTGVVPYQLNNAEKSYHPAIYLFGQFQVFDKEGTDITRFFTPLLKELFLIISIYTIRNGRGISSEGLNEILWHDKSDKDAKNNRSVNIAKLKTILEKIGHCTINKESGHWQLVTIDDGIYIDYKKYVSLVQNVTGPQKNLISAVVDILKRGAFLAQTEYSWLDNVKSETSSSVLDVCLGFIKNQDISKDPDFIIEITNYIFYFDQLNEEALIYKCKCLIYLKRHTLANNTYLKFIKDYKDIYGEDFGKTFHEVIT